MPSFARELEATLHNALGAAASRKHEYATLEHLLLALTDDRDALAVLVRHQGCPCPDVVQALSRVYEPGRWQGRQKVPNRHGNTIGVHETVGRLLRELRMQKGSVTLPGDFSVTTAPTMPVTATEIDRSMPKSEAG